MFYFDRTKIATEEEISRLALFEVLNKSILLIKIVIIGNDGVGKKLFSNTHLQSIFSPNTGLSVGCEFE